MPTSLTSTTFQLFGHNDGDTPPKVGAAVSEGNLLEVKVELGSWYSQVRFVGPPSQVLDLLRSMASAAEAAVATADESQAVST